MPTNMCMAETPRCSWKTEPFIHKNVKVVYNQWTAQVFYHLVIWTILQEAYRIQRCVLNGPEEGYRTDNKCSTSSTFRSNSLATTFVCNAMYMKLNQTQTHTPALKVTMMIMTDTLTEDSNQLSPEDVNFSSKVSVDSDLATCGFSSISELTVWLCGCGEHCRRWRMGWKGPWTSPEFSVCQTVKFICVCFHVFLTV